MKYRYGVRVHNHRHKLALQSFAAITLIMTTSLGSVIAYKNNLHNAVTPPTSGVLAKTTSAKSVLPRPKSPNSSAANGKGSVLAGGDIASLVNESCSTNKPVNNGLSTSFVPQLLKLAEYESVCGGGVVGRDMVFIATPVDTNEAQLFAVETATTLKEYAKQGIKPLVIMEPTGSKGVLNFNDYRAGKYDATLDSFFSNLKKNGLNDSIMGTWVSFPEANTPEWSNNNPDTFAANVTKTIQLQKKYFPVSQASIMLDSKSYPDGTWSSGTYASLFPYLNGIPKGLVDSFGYQGFPWPDTQPDYAAANFLKPSLAAEAANILGVKKIWLNTGTFGKAILEGGNSITLTPLQRQTILTDIVGQAKSLQQKGFGISINLFSQNKLSVTEGIDWSYWATGQVKESSAVGVFSTFIHQLQSSGIEFWLFDTV